MHALQIEVRRGLFMHERSRQPYRSVPELELVLRGLLSELASFMIERPTAPRAAATAGMPLAGF
jgi:N-formylglutamate amidohydrolase